MSRVALAVIALALAGCSDEARVDAVEVTDGGMALKIYVVGTPTMPNDSVEVEEVGQEVRIRATIDQPLSGADDGPAVYYCAEMGLEKPLGSRRVIDVSRGEEPERGRRPCYGGG